MCSPSAFPGHGVEDETRAGLSPLSSALDPFHGGGGTRPYWKAVVTAESSATFDPAAFSATAESPFIDELAAKVDHDEQIDLERVGEPTCQGHEPVVTGDQATVTVCFDQDDWKPEGVEQEPLGFKPVGAELAQHAGACASGA